MSIRVFNVKHNVNPIGLGLCYSEGSKHYVENLLPELLTSCDKSFDMYIHPYDKDEISNYDITWCVYALNKADFIITSINAETEEEFNESIAILNSYAKHPSLTNVYMLVDCTDVIDNDDYKNTIITLSRDTDNTVLFMPVSTKDELVKCTLEVINMIGDLSAFTLTNGIEDNSEVSENAVCECEECNCDESTCNCEEECVDVESSDEVTE